MGNPDDSRYRLGELLHREDFSDRRSEKDWIPEREGNAGTVEVRDGRLVIDVPKGATVWYRHELEGPILIEYEATAIKRDGPNDRVSDLNCFWMAQYPRHPGHLLDVHRGGAFAEYDALRCYYVGLGGNTNTTTRFRRYIGEPGNRPLLPEHDLSAPEYLLRPNARQHLRLIACNNLIQYWRDDRRLFELEDPAPYTRGWFGLRTVTSHLEIAHLRIYRLHPKP